MSNILQITDSSFELDVLKADKPVFVDFWAEWCGPCKAIAPIFDDSSVQYKDRVIFAKVNIDDNHDLPSKYNVRSIPTLILFKDGEVIAQTIGGKSKSELSAFLEENI